MIKCKGFWYYPMMEPPEFDCGYDKAGYITCDECIINGGDMSPVSGKKFRGNPEPYYEECRKRFGANYFDTEPIPLKLDLEGGCNGTEEI